MEKLKQLHREAINSSYHTEIYGNVDSVTEFSSGTAILNTYNITFDVSIKFAEWLTKISYRSYFEVKPSLWVDIYGTQKTTEELFEIFINDFYGK
jgi:hypothetical protein